MGGGVELKEDEEEKEEDEEERVTDEIRVTVVGHVVSHKISIKEAGQQVHQT